jgi:hypothetical protein
VGLRHNERREAEQQDHRDERHTSEHQRIHTLNIG